MVTYVNRGALGLQVSCEGAQRAVRARDRISALFKKTSDRREPAAADADEMNVSHVCEE